MIGKDFYAAADRIQLVDERLAYEMMKRNYPNFKNCKTEFDFWKGYTEVVQKDNVEYYVPFSFLMKYIEDELKYNYSIIRLIDYLTDIDKTVFLGLEYSEYIKFETDIIEAAEYLTKCCTIHPYEKNYVMKINYRKNFREFKSVYIVQNSEKLIAKVDNHIVDVAKFSYNIIVNEYPIPEDLAYQVINCIHNEFSKFVANTMIGEDDRCYMDNAFSIYVPENTLDLPKRRWGYNPYEYFYAGGKSAFSSFNKLMSFIQDNMTDYEKELFPFN